LKDSIKALSEAFPGLEYELDWLSKSLEFKKMASSIKGFIYAV
jgi:hypothetical protein